MRPWSWVPFLFAVILFVGCQAVPSPRARAGLLDLSQDPRALSQSLSLAGTWDFWPGELLDPLASPDTQAVALEVPGAWDSVMPRGEGTGWGTYRLRVLLPTSLHVSGPWGLRIMKAGTAYRVFVNGESVYTCGTVGTAEASRPHYETALIPLGPDVWKGGREIDIQIHVSNFSDRNGGLWNPLTLGPWAELKRTTEVAWVTEFFLAGAFAALALYHLLLFLFRRNDLEYLFFALANAALAAYCLVFLSCSLVVIFPSLPWDVVFKLEYGAMVLAMGAAVGYVAKIFREEISPSLMAGSLGLLVAYLVFLAFFPPLVISKAVVLVYVLLVGFLGVLLLGLVRALLRRREDSPIFLAALVVLGLGVVSDIVMVALNIPHQGLSPWGALIAMAAQAYLLSVRYWRVDQRVIVLTRELEDQNRALEEANSAFSRFVPAQFLEHLGKDPKELRLGDHVSKPMVVFFLGIHEAEALTKSLSVENYSLFLNRFHQMVGQVIRTQGGFVDKYMAHRVMALFDGDVESAIEAALQVQAAVQSFNQDQVDRGELDIHVGIGLHHGLLSLGIIGEEGRMESTVIADAVNLSSRIESLTAPSQYGILTTRATLDLVVPPLSFRWRSVGTVKVKGKTREVEMVEILDSPEGKG